MNARRLAGEPGMGLPHLLGRERQGRRGGYREVLKSLPEHALGRSPQRVLRGQGVEPVLGQVQEDGREIDRAEPEQRVQGAMEHERLVLLSHPRDPRAHVVGESAVQPGEPLARE